MSSEKPRDPGHRALERQPAATESLVPASYAEKAMSSLLRLHEDLVEEKEKRIDLYRRLMEREQSLAEMRAYVKLLEAELANRGVDPQKWAIDPLAAPTPAQEHARAMAAAPSAGQAPATSAAPASTPAAPTAAAPTPPAPTPAAAAPAGPAPAAPPAASASGAPAAPAAAAPPKPPAAAAPPTSEKKAPPSGAAAPAGGTTGTAWGQPVVAWTPGSRGTAR